MPVKQKPLPVVPSVYNTPSLPERKPLASPPSPVQDEYEDCSELPLPSQDLYDDFDDHDQDNYDDIPDQAMASAMVYNKPLSATVPKPKPAPPAQNRFQQIHDAPPDLTYAQAEELVGENYEDAEEVRSFVPVISESFPTENLYQSSDLETTDITPPAPPPPPPVTEIPTNSQDRTPMPKRDRKPPPPPDTSSPVQAKSPTAFKPSGGGINFNDILGAAKNLRKVSSLTSNATPVKPNPEPEINFKNILKPTPRFDDKKSPTDAHIKPQAAVIPQDKVKSVTNKTHVGVPAKPQNAFSDSKNREPSVEAPKKPPKFGSQDKEIGTSMNVKPCPEVQSKPMTPPKRKTSNTSETTQSVNSVLRQVESCNATDTQDKHINRSSSLSVDPLLGSKPWSSYQWYHGNIDRNESKDRLLSHGGMAGIFLIRDSMEGGPDQPYTMNVYHETVTYKLKISRGDDGRLWLGEKDDEKLTFKDVAEMVEFYKSSDIILINSKTKEQSMTKLLGYPQRP